MEPIPKDQLEKLYVVERLKHREIARRLGVTQHLVLWSLGAAGIPLRDKSGASKGRPKSPEHRAKLAENLRKARAAQTKETRKKQAASMKGRTPSNKGGEWSEETRAKHAYRQTDEYRQAMADRFRGHKSPLWRGGTTPKEALQSWEWRQRRKECYERDGWLCQDCGVHCSSTGPTRIQAHHIIPRRYAGGDELDNLTTLCVSCHKKRERRWDIRKD